MLYYAVNKIYVSNNYILLFILYFIIYIIDLFY